MGKKSCEYGCASFINQTSESGNPKHNPLWLGWVGLEMPALSSFWQLYCRRFAIDHWYRFAKQLEFGLYHNLVPQNSVKSEATYYHL